MTSKDGEIKAYVRRPVYGRKPVGYELGFPGAGKAARKPLSR